MPDRADRIRGAIYGTAYGDAFAAPTEFALHRQILERWPPAGPTDLSAHPYVTDDTEMALAVGQALEHTAATSSTRAIEPERLATELSRAFVDWSKATDHHRAPGRTCLSACANLSAGKPWVSATVAASKGCGANMRVQPVALLDLARHGLSEADRAGIAQLQAAVTHGHPTALAAADLTAMAIVYAADDQPLSALVDRLCAYGRKHEAAYHERWLADLWRRGDPTDGASFIAHGFAECDAALARVADAAHDIEHWRSLANDPCDATGEGWIAEEALATALLCVLAFPDDPVTMLQRAAVTGGDSDSIACIAGAIAGAHHGLGAWPAAWRERIEYRDELERLSAFLAGATEPSTEPVTYRKVWAAE